jgi:hypothetical protein
MGIIHDARTGDFDYTVVRAASIMLFALVVVRMAGLVRQQERSLERERVLSRAGADLVGATDRPQIERVALDATAALADAESAVALCDRELAAALGLADLPEAAVVRLEPAQLAAAGLPAGHRPTSSSGSCLTTSRCRRTGRTWPSASPPRSPASGCSRSSAP